MDWPEFLTVMGRSAVMIFVVIFSIGFAMMAVFALGRWLGW